MRSNWMAGAALGLTLLGWAFQAFAGYSGDASTLRERLARVEAHQGDLNARLERMESKLDKLLKQEGIGQ